MAPARAELGPVAGQLSASLLCSRRGKAAQQGGDLCPYAWNWALSALHGLPKAKHPTVLPQELLGSPWPRVALSCAQNARQWCCHFPHIQGSHPLCSLLHSLQRAHQVTLSARPALPPRIKGQHGFTPCSRSNKGSPMLRTGSVQTEQTGSAQRHSVAALCLQRDRLGALLRLPALR